MGAAPAAADAHAHAAARADRRAGLDPAAAHGRPVRVLLRDAAPGDVLRRRPALRRRRAGRGRRQAPVGHARDARLADPAGARAHLDAPRDARARAAVAAAALRRLRRGPRRLLALLLAGEARRHRAARLRGGVRAADGGARGPGRPAATRYSEVRADHSSGKKRSSSALAR